MTLPPDFDMRPATQNDAKAVTSLNNLCALGFLNTTVTSEDTTRKQWARLGFDLATDSRCILTADGDLIGYVECNLHKAKCVAYLVIRVHPDYQDGPYGEILMDWALKRAQVMEATLPPDMRFAMRSWLAEADKDTYLQTLLTSYDFNVIRYFNRMAISFEDTPPVAELPTGITVRFFNRDVDLPLVVRTEMEIFRDHWDHFDAPIEEELKWWAQRIDSTKSFDPTLWFLAMDGEEIAAICLCFPTEQGNDDMGWVSRLGVRRPWRHKGLGTALLRHGFNELYKRGKKQVGLMVDAASLTGALHLYENVGMRSTRRFFIFEKELRAGIDPTKQH